ncbi:NAD(+) diphosphatase [Allostreptomyces psammosilenae]|uniref:NAD(+) diphosphatase n=1 Tax=Allostreptomyces psammosilenae TaxID=1892865 RepID=UPI001FE5BA6E|nr:NAD(+) diphosphatase [Allostreptomyces psammosilenae]
MAQPPTLSRSALDRAAERRLDEAWLSAAWSHPTTRVLVIAHGRALVLDEDPPEPAAGEEGAEEAERRAPRTRLVLVSAFDAPVEGERYFLGVDPDGAAYFALAVEKLPGQWDAEARGAGLREVGALLDDRDTGLLVHAVALETWHRRHGFCPACGKATVAVAAGHVRRCTGCGTEHYPRTDPAVIMLVRDGEDRCLLGRQQHWPPGRWSILAGFVEPGESAEQAVVREVREEVGVAVTGVSYVASQPWPFPASLMLGYLATADDPRIDLGGDDEIEEARWFTREELRAAVASGELLLPASVSIARSLIDLWYGEGLPPSSW